MAKKRFARLIEERFGKNESKIYAELGDYDGVVETGIAYQVYARDRVGQVIKIYNYSVPNVAGLKVEIGRVAGQGTWQVIGARNAYQNPSLPNIPSHDALHRYLPIYRDQILPLMFLPTDTPFVIQIYGSVVVVDNVWAFVDNQTLDLTSYVPAAGALYVTLQYDTAGVVSVVTGSTLASKEILAIANVPAAAANHILFGAVRLYDNQETLDRANDLLYPFNVSGVSSTGGLPSLTPLRVAVTDSGGTLTTDNQLYYDPTTDFLVLGDIANLPLTGSRGMFIQGDGISPFLNFSSYGSAFAPFLTGWIADGTAALKTNVKNGMIGLRFRLRGWDGSAWSNTQAEIYLAADGDWSPTSRPTKIEQKVVPVGSTALTLAHTIGSDGLGRGSAMAFQRKLKESLSLADGASLVLAEYVEFGEYEIILNGDAEVVLL